MVVSWAQPCSVRDPGCVEETHLYSHGRWHSQEEKSQSWEDGRGSSQSPEEECGPRGKGQRVPGEEEGTLMGKLEATLSVDSGEQRPRALLGRHFQAFASPTTDYQCGHVPIFQMNKPRQRELTNLLLVAQSVKLWFRASLPPEAAR